MLNTLSLGFFVFVFVGLWHLFFFRFELSPSYLEKFLKKLVLDLLIGSIVFVCLNSVWFHLPVSDIKLWGVASLFVVAWHLIIFIIHSFVGPKSGDKESGYHEPSIFSKLTVQKLIVDLAIGLSMAVCLSYFQEFSFLAEPEDASMDFVMQSTLCQKIADSKEKDNPVGKCTLKEKGDKPIPPIVLLDIDNETYKNWGEPLITPRKQIKQLIQTAVKDKPKVVIVDVFMDKQVPIDKQSCTEEKQHSGAAIGDERNDHQLHSCDDKELSEYLASYANRDCKKEDCSTPIIMIRNRLPRGTESEQDKLDGGLKFEPRLPLLKLRENFLDQYVKQTSSVQWAAPFFWNSEFDGRLRRWWLWLSVCDKNNKSDVIPSIQLLVAGLINNRNLDVKALLKEITPERNCSEFYYSPEVLTEEQSKSLKEKLNLNINEGEMTGGGVRPRILFTMPWWFPPQEKEFCLPNNKVCLKGYYLAKDVGLEQRPVLAVFSALSYLEKRTQYPNSELLPTDSIVIISSSHHDANDRHQTPIGEMPGSLVLANAIYSLLLKQGEIELPPKWEKLVCEAGLILITGFFIILASRCSHSIAFWSIFIVTVVIVGFVSQFISVIYLKKGVWMDFSLPLVAILFHHIAVELHKLKKIESELQKCREGNIQRKEIDNVDSKKQQQIQQVDIKQTEIGGDQEH